MNNGAFAIWFVLCALVGMALTGFTIWAVYTLVTWVVTA